MTRPEAANQSLGWRTGFAGTLALAMALATFPMFALGALAPFIVDDLSLSRARLGTLTTVLFATGAAASLVLGPLVDRVGGRRVLFATFALGGLALAAMARAPGYSGLVAATAVAGGAIAAVNPVTNQLVSRHIPRGRQGVIMGVKQSGVQVGAFLAGALLPAGALLVGWRGVLLASAVAGLFGLALTGWFVPAVGPHGMTLDGIVSSEVAHGSQRWFVAWLSAYALLMGAGVSAVGAYLPLYAVESLGLTVTTAGLVASVVGLVGIGARITWGRASERRQAVGRPLTTIAALSVAALAMLWAATDLGPALLWIGAVVFGATAAAWNAVGMLAIVREVDRSATGRASGLVLVAFYIGFVVSPVTFGYSVDVTGGYDLGWAGLTAVFALAAVVAHHKPRTSHPQVTGHPLSGESSSTTD